MKKVYMFFRTSIKLLSLVTILTLIIISIVFFFYQPIYSVSLNGEFIGYSEDKSKLQAKINEYIKKGDGENVAFVQVDTLPEYKMCLLKKDIITTDDEIYEIVKNTGTTYYKYYAITLNSEEKYYVSNFEEAEAIINELKQKKSTNADKIGVLEKYETTKKEFTEKETVISKLYEEPKKTVTVASKNKSTYTTTSSSSSKKIALGISFIRPTSGVITSRYGARSGRTHTGIDIGAPAGTSISASASGTVTCSGWRGGYGYTVVIYHGNGVETYYAHCSSLNVSEGQQVSQGELIARVGSTGNSTGNHLHFEVRINGVAQNPQNYVY